MDERRMTADVELPPIAVSPYTDRILAAVRKQDGADPLFRILEDYARANVAHATAAKDAEIERLRAEVAKAERSVEHTHQWYAVRLEKIKEVAKRVGLWSEVAAIIANGSSSIYDPPTYAQQLNIAKHETKAAEARAERLSEEIDWIKSHPDDDRMFAEIEAAAKASFQRHRTSCRGQVLTRADSPESHMVWAALEWAKRTNGAEQHAERLAEALRLIAAPMRPDGTWNRDREACRQIARAAMREHDQEGKDG